MTKTNREKKIEKLEKVIKNLKKNYKIDKPINEIRILKYPFHPKKNYKKIFEELQRDIILYYNDETCSLAIFSCDYVYKMAKDNRKFSTAKVNTKYAKKLKKHCKYELGFKKYKSIQINEPFPGIGFKRHFTLDINTRYFINERDKLVKYYIPTKDDVLLFYIFELLKQNSDVHISPNIFTLNVGLPDNLIKVTIDCRGAIENKKFLRNYKKLYKEFDEKYRVPIYNYDTFISFQTNYYFIYRIYVFFGYTPFFKNRYFDAAYHSDNKLLIIYSHKNNADTFKDYDQPTRILKCISANYI